MTESQTKPPPPLTKEEILDYKNWVNSFIVYGENPTFTQKLAVMALAYLEMREIWENEHEVNAS